MAAPFVAWSDLMVGQAKSSFIGKPVFDRLVAKAVAEEWNKLPIGEVMGKLGTELLGTPYVAHTLELDPSVELCAINFEGLDCVTFFESTFNLARIIKRGTLSPEALIRAVRHTRYRDGMQGDYTSRLHYTTDWFYDNVKKRTIHELTPDLPGAAPFDQKVGYMSEHPEAYVQLKAHPELVAKIAETEKTINGRSKTYLPINKVADAESLLKTGDIIGVCTTQPGIDIAHTGLCFRDEAGVLHFMDASSAKSRMKVTLEGRLSEAVSWSPKNTGIIVARPLEP